MAANLLRTQSARVGRLLARGAACRLELAQTRALQTLSRPHVAYGARPWHRTGAGALALLGAGAVGVSGAGILAECSDGSVVEAETGVPYAAVGPGGRTLAGTGARLMGGVVKVYAVGLYVDGTLASQALGGEGDLWEAVADAQPLLRLVVVREVSGTHMASGFERGLARAAGKRKATPAMKKFGALFKPLGTMKVGSEMLIECDGERGTVTLEVDGRHIGEVEDAALVRSVVRMYLSPKAVTPALRADAGDNLQALRAGVGVGA